jgi:predicted O-methyltransferase YrrM
MDVGVLVGISGAWVGRSAPVTGSVTAVGVAVAGRSAWTRAMLSMAGLAVQLVENRMAKQAIHTTDACMTER